MSQKLREMVHSVLVVTTTVFIGLVVVSRMIGDPGTIPGA